MRGGFKSDAALAKQQLALKPPPSTHLEHAVSESPEIDQIFRDATIYDRKGERWIVRGINEVGGQRLIEVEGHEAELKTILHD